MKSEFKKDLVNASELKTVGKNKEALKFYEKCYNEDAEAFTINQKIDFAWTLYHVKIQNFKNEKELLDSAQFITEMLPQKDLNANRNCAYTSSIFTVLKHLNNEEKYFEMCDWIEKLDPELLDERPYRNYGQLQKSKKEKYYDWATKAYLKSMEYERCIETSKKALNTFKTFLNDGDVWYKWRIAKSLIELNRLHDALEYYLEVIKVKNDWYMYRDVAEIYYNLNKPMDALKYLCPAVLTHIPASSKASVYYLCYKVFRSFNPEMALKHAQLFYILKMEKNHSIPYEIEQLDIDTNGLNKRELEDEITRLWTQYKYKDQKRQNGTVTKFIQDKNFGFIRNDDGDEIFFHRNDFSGRDIYIGQMVSFYTERSFDKAKNKESIKAVNVRGE